MHTSYCIISIDKHNAPIINVFQNETSLKRVCNFNIIKTKVLFEFGKKGIAINRCYSSSFYYIIAIVYNN